MNDDDSIGLLIDKLIWLRLPGMAARIRDVLETAASDNLSTLDVVHRLADEEKDNRIRNAIKRRINNAKFPEVNTVDTFDFDFDAIRKQMRARYLALHDLSFIDKGINPLFHRQARHWEDLSRARPGVSCLPGHQARRLRPGAEDAQRASRR